MDATPEPTKDVAKGTREIALEELVDRQATMLEERALQIQRLMAEIESWHARWQSSERQINDLLRVIGSLQQQALLLREQTPIEGDVELPTDDEEEDQTAEGFAIVDYDGSTFYPNRRTCDVSITTGPTHDPYSTACELKPSHDGPHRGAHPLGVEDEMVEWIGGGICAGDPLPFTIVGHHPR